MYILGVLLLLIAGLVIYIALQPGEFRVERSTVISAPPEQVCPQVHILKHWEGWNPWGKLDPNMTLTYAGPPEGEGASYPWEGNRNVGSGRCTITQSTPPQRVQIRLDFLKPFKATNTGEFTFTPEGNGQTRVIWRMEGKNTFMGKTMGILMNMEKMIGGQFEKGLADMKAIVEGN